MPHPPRQLDATLRRMEFGQALKGELLMDARPALLIPYAQPLLDAVTLFETLGIGYALIGGIAAMYYGRSRFTEDVDFVAVAGHMEILSANTELMEHCHFSSDCVHKLYHKSGVQVDLWKDDFSGDIIRRAIEVQLAGRLIRVIEPHDLIAMKLRAGRLKDDYDISQIASNNLIDETRLSGMVTVEQMRHFAQIKDRA